MKNSMLIYNLELHLEKYENILNKVISNISNKKLLDKLFILLKDILIIKNKLNLYIHSDINSSRCNKSFIKEKYEEYKNIMSFL